MNFPTLQHVLETNYGITERIWVEGKFIAFLDTRQSATCLVNLGLGHKNLYIARVVFGGKTIDYELLSLVPFPLVTFAYNNALKMLKVRSNVKVTQLFQMCTNQLGDSRWDDFTTFIRYMGINNTPKTCSNQQLTAPHGGDKEVACVEVDGNCPSLLSQFYQANSTASLNFQCLNHLKNQSLQIPNQLDNHTLHQTTTPIHTCRSVSLPALLSTSADDMSLGSHCRSHSMDCVDIIFDNFVNDAPTRFSEFSNSFSCCSWNGLADNISRIHTGNLNVSNNYTTPSVTETRSFKDAPKKRKKKSSFDKIKWLFCCKKQASSC